VKIWIFGIVHRATNKLVLYPVDNRDSATLIPIILRHVAPGSRIFSDSWAAYLPLNDVGFQHFSVTHKTNFVQSYKNAETGEVTKCCTNQIEGAWRHAKDHFRKMNGTNVASFEQHLCEVIWRNHTHRLNIYDAFFQLLKSRYPLHRPVDYSYPKGEMFDTWTPPPPVIGDEKKNHTIIPAMEDFSDPEDADVEDTPPAAAGSLHFTLDSSPIPCGQSTPKPPPSAATRDSSTDSSSPIACAQATAKPGPATGGASGSDEFSSDPFLMHPATFKPLRKKKFRTTARARKGKGKGRRRGSNPYTKSAFAWDMSSDSDFQ
jgi:transposase-like protein